MMTGEQWRHKKRGTVYEIITDAASIQCSAAPEFEAMFDDDNWTVYRSIDTGAIYIRPTEEFLDGRFERSNEEACTGHVASESDPKVCARCGVHIDSLRPPDDEEG